MVGDAVLCLSTGRDLRTKLRHPPRRTALRRDATAARGPRRQYPAGAVLEFLRRAAPARAGQIAAYDTNFRLARKASNAFSDTAIVFAGPVSLMKYGPFDVSITAARKRKLGLL